MSSAQTTLSLLLLMMLGYVFRGKIKSREQRDGVRTIILSLALPATIFIALIKINFSLELLIVPLLALVFNLIMYGLVSKLPVQSLFNIPASQYRSLMLLIPSLAPGLSCFPFILEYSGEGTVAIAALADLGNKIFVLIIAYVIAMKWYFHASREQEGDRKVNVKDVLLSLINEPVNLVIATALIMLAIGLSYDSLPVFLRMSIDKISLLMTPLVLLFIGISIRLTWHQVRTIFSFLFFRSGIAFLVSGFILMVLPVHDVATALLIVVFPQSACSFWPYSHMAAVSTLENNHNTTREKTFDLDFTMNVLGCSMPFSVILILLIYSAGTTFTETYSVFSLAVALLLVAVIPPFILALRTQRYANDNTGAL
jgi:malate permease and related proteins